MLIVLYKHYFLSEISAPSEANFENKDIARQFNRVIDKVILPSKYDAFSGVPTQSQATNVYENANSQLLNEKKFLSDNNAGKIVIIK